MSPVDLALIEDRINKNECPKCANSDASKMILVQTKYGMILMCSNHFKGNNNEKQ